MGQRDIMVIDYVSPHFHVPFIVKWSHVAKGLEEVTMVIFESTHFKVIQSLFFSLNNHKAYVLGCQAVYWPVSLIDYVDQSHLQHPLC